METTSFCQHQENPSDIHIMLALALSNTVNLCMSNHFYSFVGELHKQSDGSAIGSSLTGEVFRGVMGVWDILFRKLLKKLGIILDLYKR